MLEEIIKKLAIDKAVELIKSSGNQIKEYFLNRFKNYTSYEKYMINSCKRRYFNNIYLNNADIIYTFKDNDTADKDTVALDVKYVLKGVANERINYLLLYYSMKEYNTDNISIKAYDCVDGVDRRVTTSILTEKNKTFGDNGAYWKIPFYDRTPGHMDPILTKVVLSWKRFCPTGAEAKLIIDPRNYSKSINNLTITIKNESKNFDVEYIKLSEYNRKKRKLDEIGGEYDIYNKNNDSDEYELVKGKQLLNNGVNENNIFLIKVKF